MPQQRKGKLRSWLRSHLHDDSASREPGRQDTELPRNHGSPRDSRLSPNESHDTHAELMAGGLCNNDPHITPGDNRLGATAANASEDAEPAATEFELWDKAFERVENSNTDSKIIAILKNLGKKPTGNGSPRSLAQAIMEDMQREIVSQRARKEERAWTVKIGRDEYFVRDFLEKAVKGLNKFVSVGDVAVSVDPVHAAPPWALIRAVLTSLTAYHELKYQLLYGIAKATSLALQCDLYRRLYMEPDSKLQPPSDVLEMLESSLIQAYAECLIFLGFTLKVEQSGRIEKATAILKITDLEAHMEDLATSEVQLARAADNCEKYCNYRNRTTNNRLLEIAEQLQQEHGTLLLNIERELILQKLLTAAGAAYDSHANEHDTACLPGTRVTILAEIYEWVHNSEGKCIYWLQGMAGTGKSTISRSVASGLDRRGALGASFFFKRGEGDRGNAARFFTTIAAQLIQTQPRTGEYTQTAIQADSFISEKALTEQFDKLVLKPVEEMNKVLGITQTIVLVIDALDECDYEGDVKVILNLMAQCPISTGLRFFVTSRPEQHIRLGFRAASGAYRDLVLHQMDDHVAEEDIKCFLEFRMSRIRDDFNHFADETEQLPTDWPNAENFGKLVRMSAPLFIFASTACLYIEDRRPGGSPDSRLQTILEYYTPRGSLGQTYSLVLGQMLQGLDAYDRDKAILEFKAIVGSIVLLATPLSRSSLAYLLDKRPEAISGRLGLLHSVLDIPAKANAPVKLFHLSFRDFLINNKGHEFAIEERKTHEKLANQCLNVLSSSGHLKQDICGLVSPGTLREDVEIGEVDSCLPPQVQYACLYWVYHLTNSEALLSDDHQIIEFLEKHFLHWLEALSLLRRMADSIGLIKRLLTLVDSHKGLRLGAFLQDSLRFVQSFRAPIEQAPLQTYSAALVFAPAKSIIRKMSENQVTLSWVNPKPKIGYNWSTCLHTLESYARSATLPSGIMTMDTIAFSPDSNKLASGGVGGGVKVWDIATGTYQQSIGPVGGDHQGLVFSADEPRLYSASPDHPIRVWDVSTGEPHSTIELQGDVRTEGDFERQEFIYKPVARFSADGKMFALQTNHCKVRIWNIPNGDIMQDISIDARSAITTLAFSPGNQLLAIASLQKEEKDPDFTCHQDYDVAFITIWDIRQADMLQCWRVGRKAMVMSLAFSPDAQLVAWGATGGSDIQIRDIKWSGMPRHTLKGSQFSNSAVTFSPDGKLFASDGKDNQILIWDLSNGGTFQYALNGHSSEIVSLRFSADGQLLASESLDGHVKIWDMTRQEISSIEVPRGLRSGCKARFSPDSQRVALWAYGEKIVLIWSTESGDLLHTLVNSSFVECMAWSPDSQALVTVCEGYMAGIWDAATGLSVCTITSQRPEPTQGFSRPLFSPDRNQLALLQNNIIGLWDAMTGEFQHVLREDQSQHHGYISSSIYSTDSFLLATSSSEVVKVWDTKTGSLRHALSFTDDTTSFSWFSSLAFSPDGQTLAAGRSRVLRAWDTATWAVKYTLNISGRGIHFRSITFSPDGRHLATAGDDHLDGGRGVRVWDAVTGKLLRILENYDDGMAWVPLYRPWYGYSLSKRTDWITWRKSKVLWLPTEYRPSDDFRYDKYWASKTCIAISAASGKFLIFGFPPLGPPQRKQN